MFHADGPAGPPCIVGRYRLTGRVMGKGNYARVVEALHLDVNVHVAIKVRACGPSSPLHRGRHRVVRPTLPGACRACR